MKRLATLIAIVATLIPMAALAATWWNNDWKYRKEISLDLSATGADVDIREWDESHRMERYHRFQHARRIPDA